MPINDSECLLQLYKNRRKRQNKFFPMLNGPCSSLFCSHALTLLLTTFSPKTDETDGMMDRPPQNQTNTPAKREEKKKQASKPKQARRKGLHPSYPSWWMDDWLLTSSIQHQTNMHIYYENYIFQQLSSPIPCHDSTNSKLEELHDAVLLIVYPSSSSLLLRNVT